MARRIGGKGGGSDPGAGKAGAVVAAGVLAISAAASSGGLSLGGGATSVESVGTNLTRAKSEGGKSARKGDADGAWRQVNMRTLKRVTKPALECLSRSCPWHGSASGTGAMSASSRS